MNKSEQDTCESCLTVPRFTADKFYDFFRGNTITCYICGESLADWWSIVQNCIEGPFLFNVFPPLGYDHKAFVITMKPRQNTMVNLNDYRIPTTALILGVSYFALDDFLKPVENTGRELRPETAERLRKPDGTYEISPVTSSSLSRLQIPHQFKLYGAEVGPGTPGDTRVRVWVEWVDPDDAEIAAIPLFWALEAFVMGRYAAALILAQTVSEVKVKQLLRKRGDYFDLLKMLPEEADRYGVPRLSQDISDLLDRLRQERNKLIHKGKMRTSLKRSHVAEFLCTTVFGVHYINFVMDAKRSKNRPTQKG